MFQNHLFSWQIVSRVKISKYSFCTEKYWWKSNFQFWFWETGSKTSYLKQKMFFKSRYDFLWAALQIINRTQSIIAKVFITFLVGFRFTRTSCGAVLPIKRMGTAWKYFVSVIEKLGFSIIEFWYNWVVLNEQVLKDSHRKANVDHQVLVVGGLSANLQENILEETVCVPFSD